MTNTILAAILVIVVVTLILVALLLFIKIKLTPSGTVKIDINGGKKVLDVPQGGSLLNTLAEQKIFLPSACGGKGDRKHCGERCDETETLLFHTHSCFKTSFA